MNYIIKLAKWYLGKHGYTFINREGYVYNFTDFTLSEFRAIVPVPRFDIKAIGDDNFIREIVTRDCLNKLIRHVEVSSYDDPRCFDRIYSARIFIGIRDK